MQNVNLVIITIQNLAHELAKSVANVQDGWTYRSIVNGYEENTSKVVNTLFPEPILRGDGSWDDGVALSPLGARLPAQICWDEWLTFRNRTALALGVKPAFAGVSNYLTPLCPPR